MSLHTCGAKNVGNDSYCQPNTMPVLYFNGPDLAQSKFGIVMH